MHQDLRGGRGRLEIRVVQVYDRDLLSVCDRTVFVSCLSEECCCSG